MPDSSAHTAVVRGTIRHQRPVTSVQIPTVAHPGAWTDTHELQHLRGRRIQLGGSDLTPSGRWDEPWPPVSQRQGLIATTLQTLGVPTEIHQTVDDEGCLVVLEVDMLPGERLDDQ